MKKKVLDGVLGLAIGEAKGNKTNLWSQGTSLSLALMEGLQNGLNYFTIVTNYIKWLQEGAYTPTGEVLFVDKEVEQALSKFHNTYEPLACGSTREESNGSGSLNRMLPAVFYLSEEFGFDCDDEIIGSIVHDLTAITHGHVRSQIGSTIYVMIAMKILQGKPLVQGIEEGLKQAQAYYQVDHFNIEELNYYQEILSMDVLKNEDIEIKCKDNVVDILEGALWCLCKTDSYEACIERAVSLKDNQNNISSKGKYGTVQENIAAVAGGLAGIYYGVDHIPQKWKDELVNREYIERICRTFAV